MEVSVFRMIPRVIINEDHAFVLTCTVDTLCFDEYFSAYCIKDRDDSISIIKLSDEMDEKIYIVPYCVTCTIVAANSCYCKANAVCNGFENTSFVFLLRSS